MDILLLVMLILLWGLVHSLLASLKAKELARQFFGPAADRFYRLAYNLFAGVSFLAVLAAAALLPGRELYRVPLPWSLLMLAGQFLALLALLIGFRQSRPMEFLGLQQALSSEETPGGLTISGLYRYVRHPLYTAGLALLWLTPWMTTHILAINIGATIYIVIGAYFEERKLRREFGQEYADYAAVTPMFIPFLSELQKVLFTIKTRSHKES